MSNLTPAVRRLVARLRRALAAQLELHERRALLDRPWEEELLHWVRDGEVHDGEPRWHLHGRLVPPAGRARRSVTARGWCPGLAASRTATRVTEGQTGRALPGT